MTGTLRTPCFHELQKDATTDETASVAIPTIKSLTDLGTQSKFDYGANTECLSSCNSANEDERKNRKNCICEIGLQGFVCYGSKLTHSQRIHVRRLQRSRNASKGPSGSKGTTTKSGASADAGDQRGSRNSSCQRKSSPSPTRIKRIGNNEIPENKNQLMGSNKKDKWKTKDTTSKGCGRTNVHYTATKQLTKGSDSFPPAKTVRGRDRTCQQKKRIPISLDEQNKSKRKDVSQAVDKDNSKIVNHDRVLGLYVPRSTDEDLSPICTWKNNDYVSEPQPITSCKENQNDFAQNSFEKSSTESIDKVNVHYFALSCQKHSTSEKSSGSFDNPVGTNLDSTESKESYTNFRKTKYVKLEEQQIGTQNVVNAYFISSSAQTSSQSFQRWSSKNDYCITDEILCEGSQCTGRTCTQEQSMKGPTENLGLPLESEGENTECFVISPAEISVIVDSGDYEHHDDASTRPVSIDAILDYCDARTLRDIVTTNRKDCSTQILKDKPNQNSEPSILQNTNTENSRNCSDDPIKAKVNVCEPPSNYERHGSALIFSSPTYPKANRNVCVPSVIHDVTNETIHTNTKEVLNRDDNVPLFIHNLTPENNKKCQPLNSAKMTDHIEHFPGEDTKQNPRPTPGTQKGKENRECHTIPKDCNEARTNLSLQPDKPRVQPLPSNNNNVSFSVILQQTNSKKNEKPVIHASQNNETMKITVEVNATSSNSSLCAPREITVKRRTKSANDPYFKRYEQFAQNTTKLLFQYDFNKANNANPNNSQ